MDKGIYGKCESCGNPIYYHQEENIEIFDDTGLCGACATGDASVYTEELF